LKEILENNFHFLHIYSKRKEKSEENGKTLRHCYYCCWGKSFAKKSSFWNKMLTKEQ
jgi:hypothetical protein